MASGPLLHLSLNHGAFTPNPHFELPRRCKSVSRPDIPCEKEETLNKSGNCRQNPKGAATGAAGDVFASYHCPIQAPGRIPRTYSGVHGTS